MGDVCASSMLAALPPPRSSMPACLGAKQGAFGFICLKLSSQVAVE